MIKGFAHLCFIVRDLDAALEFYRDTLGLEEVFDFKDDNGNRFGVYLHAGHRNFIELFKGEHAGPSDQHSYRHFCLEVDNLKEVVAQLQEKRVPVTEPKLGSDNSLQAWISDPDGNRIELHQYLPDSKQLRAFDAK